MTVNFFIVSDLDYITVIIHMHIIHFKLLIIIKLKVDLFYIAHVIN